MQFFAVPAKVLTSRILAWAPLFLDPSQQTTKKISAKSLTQVWDENCERKFLGFLHVLLDGRKGSRSTKGEDDGAEGEHEAVEGWVLVGYVLLVGYVHGGAHSDDHGSEQRGSSCSNTNWPEREKETQEKEYTISLRFPCYFFPTFILLQ